MSLQAYQKTAASAESPRETEYRLFAQVTRALLEASACDPSDFRRRIDALDWNRRVWSAMAQDCASTENPLPAPLKASIISLSIWVGKHTSAVIRREDEIDALIDVNRIIMQGLAPTTAAASAAA